jgi:ABC-type iron transport system FetAB permease component
LHVVTLPLDAVLLRTAMSGPETHLGWDNVGIGLAFVVFDAVLSGVYGLGVGKGLVTAAIRCIVQLALMGLVLQKIFDVNNPWGVVGISRE